MGNKLSAVISQWSRATFSIAHAPVPQLKGRKVLIFHSQATSELLSNLDESQVRALAPPCNNCVVQEMALGLVGECVCGCLQLSVAN